MDATDLIEFANLLLPFPVRRSERPTAMVSSWKGDLATTIYSCFIQINNEDIERFPPNQLVSILAHEIGHVLVYAKMPQKQHAYTALLYTLIRDKKISYEQLVTVLQNEIEAWNEAREVLQLFGFTAWHTFNMTAEYALDSYYNLLKKAA